MQLQKKNELVDSKLALSIEGPLRLRETSIDMFECLSDKWPMKMHLNIVSQNVNVAFMSVWRASSLSLISW